MIICIVVVAIAFLWLMICLYLTTQRIKYGLIISGQR